MAVTAQVRAPQVDATIAELKRLYGDRLTTAHAVREQHGKDISYHEAHLPDAVVFAESAEEVQAIVQLCARHKTPIIPFGTGTSLEGHISAPERRHLARPQPHEQGAAGQRGRPRRRRAARRHPQAAQRIPARHRAVLSDRSRRRRLDRRHGQHARLGHQRGALRHDARERAGAAGRHRRRPPDASRPPLAQVERGLRPGEAVRRLRGHAGRHHRDHAAPLRHSRIDRSRRPAPSTTSRARSTP